MPWPYEEYTLFENILGMGLLYLTMLLGYLILKHFLSRRLEPVEEGTDVPDEEYWDED
ncbi:MAG: hypothetical protein ACXACG_14450 [Candidatus Thorarchaeota archaeon]|jgi:hypothetical protein